MGEFYQNQLDYNRALNTEGPIMSDYGSNFAKYSDEEKSRLRAGTPGAPPITPNTAEQNLSLLQRAAAEVTAPKIEPRQVVSPVAQNRSGQETVSLVRGGGENVIDMSGRPGFDATVRSAAQQGETGAALANQALGALSRAGAQIKTFDSPVQEMLSFSMFGNKPLQDQTRDVNAGSIVESQMQESPFMTGKPLNTTATDLLKESEFAKGKTLNPQAEDKLKESMFKPNVALNPQAKGGAIPTAFTGNLTPQASEKTNFADGSVTRPVSDWMQQKPPKIDQRLYGLGDYRGIYSTPRRTEL